MNTPRRSHWTHHDPRRVGGRYRCGYWGKEYTVDRIEVGRYGVPTFTVTWADGHSGTHCTAWDYRKDAVLHHPGGR